MIMNQNLKIDKENYQKQIEDLFRQLKDVKHCC